jgi:hypothetical protein
MVSHDVYHESRQLQTSIAAMQQLFIPSPPSIIATPGRDSHNNPASIKALIDATLRSNKPTAAPYPMQVK